MHQSTISFVHTSGVPLEPQELVGTQAMRVSWTTPNWQSVPYIEYLGPWDVSPFNVIAFRAAWTNWFDFDQRPIPIPMQWITVELTSGAHSVTRHLWEFCEIPIPYNVGFVSRNSEIPYNIPTTVRVPLRSFLISAASDFDLRNVDSLRIYFYFPYNGEIFLDDIEFSR